MAQIPTGTGGATPGSRAPNDIYTALCAIALAVVLGTLAFVIYRCNELLGSPFPSFSA